MAGFPLFRLPLLPLKSVLNKMHIGDLISFQLCSKKTQDLLKTVKKSVSIDTLPLDQKKEFTVIDKIRLLIMDIQNVHVGCYSNVFINIEIGADIGIRIKIESHLDKYRDFFPLAFNVECKQRKRKYAGKGGNLEIGDVAVPIVMLNYIHTFTFWTNQSDGLKTLVNYFKRLFYSPTITFCYNGSQHCRFSEFMRVALKGISQETINSCKIYSADWFTFENLIAMDCEKIIILESRLTNYDMCKYLKLWTDGKFSKLKNLTVQLRDTVYLWSIRSALEGYSKIFYFSETRVYSKTCSVDLLCNVIHIKRHEKTVAKVSASQNMIQFDVL